MSMDMMRKSIFGGGEGLTLAVVLSIVLVFSGLPLFLVARMAFIAEGVVTVEPFLETLRQGSTLRALAHSVESGLLSALFATVIGTAFAFLIGLTDLRGKGPAVFLLLLPMMIPPHVTAISWIQALGPSSPVLGALGLAPDPGSSNPLYSLGGLVALLALQHSPLVFLIVRAALRALPAEMSDAARISGASPFRVLFRVLLPLIAPSLVAAFALAFVSALGNFGINALIGVPARYTTLPVLIWQRLASFGPGMLSNVALVSALLALVALAAVVVQSLAERRRRFSLIGLPQAPLMIRLGAARPVCEALLALFVITTVMLPLAALVGTALVPVYGVPLTLETLTFRHFAEILFRQSVTIRAFANSSFLAGLAAVLLAAISIAIGFYVAGERRRRRQVGAGVAGLADIAYAIPGLVLSIGFILAFIRPLPLIDVSLYNTLWIILFAYLGAFLAIALKPVNAAYAQLDSNLDAAARLAGAGFLRRILRVFAPLVAPAAASGALLVFLTAYNEVTVSALLWSSGKETIGTTIFNYEDGGYSTLAAAMASVTILVTVVAMVGLHHAGRYMPRGVVPWRD